MKVKDRKENLGEFNLEELRVFLEKNGYPRFYANQIFGWVYKKRVKDFDLMTDISKEGRRFLKNNFYFPSLELIKREVSWDGTEKFLFRLEDNSKIETVLIPEGKRITLCVSTQVGCKFKCRFCVSGLSGFKRNLKASEIISQFLEVERISKYRITNIVFMGIGEPLDNFENLIKSIEIITTPCGIYFGKRRICISTIGITPMIRKLKELKIGIKLSISLHSADEKIRTFLMPGTKKFPLKELMKTIRDFSKGERFPVTFEYLMIKDINSQKDDALKLSKLLKGINCKINLISYNPSPYFKWQTPSQEDIEVFKRILRKAGIFFTVRRPRGQDIKAACGQLRAEFV